MRRVIAFQGTIALVTALVFMYMGYQKIESSLFGGVISILNTILLAKSVEQAGEAAPVSYTHLTLPTIYSV